MQVNSLGLQIINSAPDGYHITSTASAKQWIKDLIDVELNENQYSALVSFLTTITKTQFSRSALRNLINKHQFVIAGHEILDWTLDGKRECAYLKKRRREEHKLWLRPIVILCKRKK